MGERVTVEGTVENVIFHNEENGYTVLLLTVEGEEEPVTVVGCIPCAAAGEGMTVTGVWSVHPVHGSQLTAESVERRMPEREEDMIAYLSSGILKGIGPATAQRLVERFGADTCWSSSRSRSACGASRASPPRERRSCPTPSVR